MGEEALAIGIDLGTTYTCAGVWQNNRVKLIPNLDVQGTYLFPSCVAFRDEERYIGSPAKNQAIRNPEKTIYSIKRLMGRRFTDEMVQRDLKRWPFEVVKSADNRPKILVQFEHKTKLFPPQEISSMILTKVKKTAEDFLGREIKNAVITVPAYFDELQREATIDAGKIAGLNVLHILDEPTAAAVAYGIGVSNTSSNERNVLVFDLGGGTFDVSILCIKRNLFKVKAISGDTHLGGDDFDNCLMDYLIEEINMKHKRDISKNARALSKLKKACEEAKISLTSSVKTEVNFDHEGLEDNYDISRAFFERLNEDLFDKCIEIVKMCLKEANLDKNNVNDVLLVGGSTRIPKVKELLKEFFGNNKLFQTINPDEAVAHGAAIMAAKISGYGSEDVQELDVTGITPLSLGIETMGGVMSVVVPRNTPIPTKMEKEYVTAKDNQTKADIIVYQGERTMIKDNILLGEFVLVGIPPAPSGESKIDVCFEIDIDGVMKVMAKDRTHGHKNQITVTNVEGRLSRDEVEKMIKEAQKYRRHDEEYKRRCEAKNSLESYAYKMSTRLKDMSGSRTESWTIKTVKAALEDAIGWVDKNEFPAAFESEEKLKELEKICDLLI